MADVMAASELVISRAGASTLAELTALGRASILMPYPYHRDQHQAANAECLARRGAARVVIDRKEPARNAAALRAALAALMSDHARREEMSAAARKIGAEDAASKLADTILSMLESRRTEALPDSLEVTCGIAR
jgi:UDP-N-acetylglucosamine--N-acetylmuramyl-(pentapeptide) pyrophosphoryl-undecaprenol N-acetylglucosamine transferase